MSTIIAQGARRAPSAFKETKHDQELSKTGQTGEACCRQIGKACYESLCPFRPDEYGKPRGARFAATDPEVLAKAAQAMSLRLFEAGDPELAEIAKQLPAGRLHASGEGRVP